MVWYQQVFTVALMWLSILIIISVAPPTPTPLRTRGENLAGLGKLIGLTWIWDWTGLLWTPPRGPGDGSCRRVAESLIDVREDQPPPHRQTPKYLLRAPTGCDRDYFFTLSALILWHCLCTIAFGASSFYSFLYQKCTTLYHMFNYWNLFQEGKLCLVKKKKKKKKSVFLWEYLERHTVLHTTHLYTCWNSA